ncbi:MAG: acyl-CoA/acyl-ACP dehydrogenase [Caulobacteraceae bacterium]|nr:acyl-CoA/acyl-ACP dehydrogenase [Caulobacteraceae bacterium]
MNFLLSDEQQQLQDALARLLRAECPSRRVHEIMDSQAGYDADLWGKLLEFGVGGACIDAAYGGSGMEMIDLALMAEALGFAGAPAPFLGHALAGLAIGLSADEEAKAEWLPKLASGEAMATVAFAEAEADWQPEQWTLTAAPGLSGTKHGVPNGLEAQLAVVGLAGGRLALVELDQPGISRRRPVGVDLTRPLDVLTFENARARLLQGPPALADRVRDAALVLLAADAFGGATRALEMAVRYSQERVQFGVTIAHFQALRHQLADMALEAEPCRGLYWYAAYAFDHVPEEASHAAAQAKAYVCETFLQVSRAGLEAHGGIGFTVDADPHIWVKRAMFDFAWMGMARVHRARAAELSGW